MTHWMCSNCGYYLQTEAPPSQCPGCTQACAFNDVTCYRPECGGEKNIDPLLVGTALRVMRVVPKEAKASVVPATMWSLPTVELFRGLTEKQKQRVRSLGHIETYEANATICTQGSEARKLYLVEEGQVSVATEVLGGMHIPVTVASPGGAFGWSALVPPHKFTATQVALVKTKVLAIERDALLPCMKDDPALGLTIMQNVAAIVASRLRNLEVEMTGLLQGRSA